MLDDLREKIKKWEKRPYIDKHSDTSRFLLMVLIKEEPLTLKELEERVFLFISQFGLEHGQKRYQNHREAFDVAAEIEHLMRKGMVVLTHNAYELTEKGRERAVESTESIERGAQWVRKNLLSPGATARNTVIADFFLALLKLAAGFISGSVGLLADGADAAVDTVSASIVWIGIKMKREQVGTIVIIIMMGVTGVSVGYESVTKIANAILATLEPMSRPYLVIGVEGVALIAAAILCFYQGFMGKKFGSLALISQSIDSKNHIYVAAAVIAGAFFSIFGIHYVDAIIGVYISFKILKDGIGLLREVISLAKGEETDFSKYEVFFEKRWRRGSQDSFRFWILYSLREKSLERDELIRVLEGTFKQTYIPLLSEFGFAAAEGFDFEKEFDTLVQPLLDETLLTVKGNTFMITKSGRQYADTVLRSMRYHQLA